MKFDTIQSTLPARLLVGYCFVISGLIVNLAQLLTWVFIWPFSKQLYRRANYYLNTLLWSRK